MVSVKSRLLIAASVATLMAGQSVGMVKQEEPVADIIAQLMSEAAHALEKRAA